MSYFDGESGIVNEIQYSAVVLVDGVRVLVVEGRVFGGGDPGKAVDVLRLGR